MGDTYEKVKAVIVDVLKVDDKEVKENTRFVRRPEGRFNGSILPDRWFLRKVRYQHQ